MRSGPGGPEGWRHRAPLGRLGAASLATHGTPSSRQGDELHELTPARVSRSVRNGAGGPGEQLFREPVLGGPGDSAGAPLPASRPEHGLHSTTFGPRAHWQSPAPGPHLSSG